MAMLGALRNLSYGRANVENKLQIASDAGLPELSLLLKTTRHSEVKYMYNKLQQYTYILYDYYYY